VVTTVFAGSGRVLRGGAAGGILELRLLGGFRRGLVLQRAAALLIVLGEEVRFLGLLFAFEGRQGDFQRLADLLRLGEGKAKPENQGQMQCGSQKKREAEPVRRADSGGFRHGMADSGVHRRSGRLEVPRSLPALSLESQAPSSKLLAGSTLQLRRDRVHEPFADAGIKGIVDFADAGRAGDVDFGEVVADHIQADKQQAALA